MVSCLKVVFQDMTSLMEKLSGTKADLLSTASVIEGTNEGVSSKPRVNHILIKIIEVRCKRSGDSLSTFSTDATQGLMIAEKSRLKNRHSQCKNSFSRFSRKWYEVTLPWSSSNPFKRHSLGFVACGK